MTNRDYLKRMSNEKISELILSGHDKICDCMKAHCYDTYDCMECIKMWLDMERNPEAEPSHTDSYELYVLDSFSDDKPRLTLYNTYKVKPENILITNPYGNTITTYNTTDGTQIIFANNGITIIGPKGHEESFTQGYMRRIGDSV